MYVVQQYCIIIDNHILSIGNILLVVVIIGQLKKSIEI